jgi:hypothetical protein
MKTLRSSGEKENEASYKWRDRSKKLRKIRQVTTWRVVGIYGQRNGRGYVVQHLDQSFDFLALPYTRSISELLDRESPCRCARVLPRFDTERLNRRWLSKIATKPAIRCVNNRIVNSCMAILLALVRFKARFLIAVAMMPLLLG